MLAVSRDEESLMTDCLRTPDDRFRDLPSYGFVSRCQDARGAAISRLVRDGWKHAWNGQSFMAVGVVGPVIGAPPMRELARVIRGCPPPLELTGVGHFVEEWGERVVSPALESFAAG